MRAPERPRILVLSTPNTAGSVYSNDELDELALICRRFKMLCISDERLSPLLFDEVDHHSISRHYPEGTVIVHDTKWCGGCDLEVLLFPDQLEWLQNAMTNTVPDALSMWTPFQYALCSTFDNFNGGEIQQYLNVQRIIYNALTFKAFNVLQAIEGSTVHRPQGGFHIFADFSEVSGVNEVLNDESLSKMMLRESDVMGADGCCFGRDPNELSMRFSMVDFEGESILDDLENMPDDVESDEMEKFITDHCPRTVRGLEAVHVLLRHPTINIQEEKVPLSKVFHVADSQLIG